MELCMFDQIHRMNEGIDALIKTHFLNPLLNEIYFGVQNPLNLQKRFTFQSRNYKSAEAILEGDGISVVFKVDLTLGEVWCTVTVGEHKKEFELKGLVFIDHSNSLEKTRPWLEEMVCAALEDLGVVIPDAEYRRDRAKRMYGTA